MSINPLFATMCGVSSQAASHLSQCTPSDRMQNYGGDSLPNEYPEYIGGLHSDNIITPDQVQTAYYEQIIKGQIAQPTPFSIQFLSPQNVEYIRQQIETNIRNYTKEDDIRFLLTKEFAQTMIDTTRNNMGMAFGGKVAIDLMNSQVIHHETEIALLSLRHNKRYERWVLHADHSRIMPYGYPDKVLHVKGENGLTTSGYELNHPFKSQYQAFLNDVLHVQCPSNSSAPCRVPSYPLKMSNP